MTNRPKAATGTQLLDKALDIIDLVESSGQRLTASAIAQISGYPKPTANRILAALVRRGFLAIDRRDLSYELGMRFTQLAATLRHSHHLVTRIEDEMISLSTRSGETVSLAVAEPASARIVCRYHLGLEGMPGGPAGAKRPYHASAIGKALLSGMPERQALRHIARIDFERFTPNTIARRERLLADLQITRARGHALDDEEIVAGTRCVAVPIFDRAGTVTAAISLSGPRSRMNDERVTEIASALGVIAAAARGHLPSAAENRQENHEISCLRGGGLFDPLAMAVNSDNIRIVDAGAQALRTFSHDGMLTETAELSGPIEAAALGAAGEIMLGAGRRIQLFSPRLDAQAAELPHGVAALAFGPDGQAYALTCEGGVHDALSGKQLFKAAERPRLMAVADKLFCLCIDRRVLLYTRGGAIVHKIEIDGCAQALAATDNQVWVADGTHILRIAIATGEIDHIDAPEQRIAAIAPFGTDTWLAGANFGAKLSDFGENTRNCGALYRWKHLFPAKTVDPVKDRQRV
jgi:DNA-binding IclR family transcriptional regulator